MGGGLIARALVIGAMVVLGACKRDTGTQASGPYAGKVAESIPKIEKATGLKFKTPPRVEKRTKEEVRSFLTQRFRDELPAAELAGMARVYKRFGLLPDSMDLEKFMLALLSEQVVGYYDPKPKVLYVVEGADDQLVGVTISHELIHALQDQYFNLDSLQAARANNDRSSAAQAVVEGQATLEQIGAMVGDNFATRLPGGWEKIRQTIRESQSTMPVFASAPTLLQETLIFPYLSGAEFMRKFKDTYPGKTPYAQMPTSTEQIMHEDRYFAATRDTPTEVTLPAPKTGKVVFENNLGEFETRLLLFEYLRDQPTAVRGAAGWDGDKYQLVDVGRGEALSWLSVWDTSIDAAEFFSDLDIGVLKRYGGVTPKQASQELHVYRIRGRTLSIAIGDVNGRPVVLFSDVPDGVSAQLIDIGRVTLKE